MNLIKIIAIIMMALIILCAFKFIIDVSTTDSRNYPYGKDDDASHHKRYPNGRRKRRKKN